MACRKIEGLPNLPGNHFVDPTLMDFRKSQTFDYVNGYRLPRTTYLGVGACPIPEQERSVKDIFETYNYDPSLTYGKPRPKAPPIVVPNFVKLDKHVLKFYAYYKESCFNSQQEHYRVRNVEIWYYLVDDTIMVIEPVVQNSGLMQGKFLKRHKVPKNNIGECWHWKDLNIACDILMYGRAFRIYDADCFTKAFYEREGIIMNDPETLPGDPFTDHKRLMILQKPITCSGDIMRDKKKKYMEFEGQTLNFKIVWDDRHREFGTLRKLVLLYHLEDDCVEVLDVFEANSGRDPNKLMLHKIRLPKNYKNLPLTFPTGCLEATEIEYVEYYEPKDLKIGETINIFGRRCLIYDMDECTKKFYREYFGYTDFTPICIFPKKEVKTEIKPPPWNGYGSPEDSLQSWLHIVPRRPRYDAMKALIFELKVLKFGAVLDSTRPEDQGREFTISYRLVDDKIAVYERNVRNSGWVGGKFLDYSRLQKPGSSNDDPVYYQPHDFYIGAVLDFYGHRFCLRCADRFVLEYMNKNPDCFPECVKENLRNYFECEARNNSENRKGQECDPGPPVCEEPIGEGFFEYLGMGTERINENPCLENPNPCKDPFDWNMCKKLGYNCGIQRPELRDNEMEPIDQVCGKPCPGNPDMFEEKECAVCSPERYVAPDPLMPNPKYEDGFNEKISPEDYYKLREHQFDCYNYPTKEKQADIQQKRLQFFCPCPPCDEQGNGGYKH